MSANSYDAFRKGRARLSCRKTFLEKRDGQVVQYAGLYAGGRLLSMGDMLAVDAEVIVKLFNESVVRRLARRKKS